MRLSMDCSWTYHSSALNHNSTALRDFLPEKCRFHALDGLGECLPGRLIVQADLRTIVPCWVRLKRLELYSLEINFVIFAYCKTELIWLACFYVRKRVLLTDPTGSCASRYSHSTALSQNDNPRIGPEIGPRKKFHSVLGTIRDQRHT